MSADTPAAAPAAPQDPFRLVRSPEYLKLLVVAAILGVPVSAAAYGFLALVGELQSWTYTDLPEEIGFQRTPPWWPLPLLVVAGLLVGTTIRRLPGEGGHKPAEGLKATGVARPIDLPGIFIAALATLSLGAVLGPEAPLIALGGGLAAGALRLMKRNTPPNAVAVVGSAGSFAAISTLLGSPLLGAFLLMEASGLGGPLLGMVLVPGLLASGVGTLVFIGLDAWGGLGTYSLTLINVPPVSRPDTAEFGWALVIGVAAAVFGAGIHRLSLWLQARVELRTVPATVLMGLVVGGLAIAYAESSGKEAADVLYSGQDALNPLLAGRASYSVGVLVLLLACKGLAYCASLSSFRGGPIFPAMFLGGVGGIVLSHCPGLPVTYGFAMGIGAMSVAMLKLPMVSVLLATLLLGSPGLTVMPVVIVAVVVSYVVSLRLAPTPPGSPPPPPEAPEAPKAPKAPDRTT
ncbi:chloride channel protein [Embleya sp. NPDC005575]|uniref:chloride channel protein n=1 Tax=Embleya sp. NPDC005575 TaxID=3156892 RepID=UPI0033B97A5B